MGTDPALAFCWKVLPEVSRSFALVIRLLPRKVGNAVMTSYLLCRIADTIEDSSLPPDEKRACLRRFAAAVASGGAFEPPACDYPQTYRELMSRANDVLACFRSLPAGVRALIAERVTEMCAGMGTWCDREIRTLADQNEYCYFVAGLVGNLL